MRLRYYNANCEKWIIPQSMIDGDKPHHDFLEEIVTNKCNQPDIDYNCVESGEGPEDGFRYPLYKLSISNRKTFT